MTVWDAPASEGLGAGFACREVSGSGQGRCDGAEIATLGKWPVHPLCQLRPLDQLHQLRQLDPLCQLLFGGLAPLDFLQAAQPLPK